MSLSLSVRSTRVCTIHSAAASLVWSVLTVDPLVVAQFFSLRNSFVHDDLQLSSSVGVLAPYSFSGDFCLLTLGLLRRQVVDFKVLVLLPRRTKRKTSTCERRALDAASREGKRKRRKENEEKTALENNTAAGKFRKNIKKRILTHNEFVGLEAVAVHGERGRWIRETFVELFVHGLLVHRRSSNLLTRLSTILWMVERVIGVKIGGVLLGRIKIGRVGRIRRGGRQSLLFLGSIVHGINVGRRGRRGRRQGRRGSSSSGSRSVLAWILNEFGIRANHVAPMGCVAARDDGQAENFCNFFERDNATFGK